MALKKGTWVKLIGHETYGTIVEQRKGDAELPDEQRSYKIHVEEQTLYYPPSHFEVQPDPAPPEYVLRAQRLEKFLSSAQNFSTSPTPANKDAFVDALNLYFAVKPKG